jgi:hypothetical protein
MQTIIPFPSAADVLFSKCVTKSKAICFNRCSLPTTASLLAHFAKRFCFSVSSSSSVTSSTLWSNIFWSVSLNSILAKRLS